MESINTHWSTHDSHDLDSHPYDMAIMENSHPRRVSMSSEPGFTTSPMSSSDTSGDFASMPPTPAQTDYVPMSHLHMFSQAQQHFISGYSMSMLPQDMENALPSPHNQQHCLWPIQDQQTVATLSYSNYRDFTQMQLNVAELQQGPYNADVTSHMSPQHHGSSTLDFSVSTNATGAYHLPYRCVQPTSHTLASTNSHSPLDLTIPSAHLQPMVPLEAEFDLFIDPHASPSFDNGSTAHVTPSTLHNSNTLSSWSQVSTPSDELSQSSWDMVDNCSTPTSRITISPPMVHHNATRMEIESRINANLGSDCELESNPCQTPRSNRTRKTNRSRKARPSRCSSSGVTKPAMAAKKVTASAKTEIREHNGNHFEVNVPKDTKSPCRIEGCGRNFNRSEHRGRHEHTVHFGGSCLDCVLNRFGEGFWCKINLNQIDSEGLLVGWEEIFKDEEDAKNEIKLGDVKESASDPKNGKPVKKKGGISRHDNKIQHYVTHLRDGGRNKTADPRLLEMAEHKYFPDKAAHTMALVYRDVERKIMHEENFRIGVPDMDLQMAHAIFPDFEDDVLDRDVFDEPVEWVRLDWLRLVRLQEERDGRLKCKF